MPFIKATHVIIEYGDPIYPKELPRSEQKFLGKQVQEIITNTLKKNAIQS
jgi:1-acyl-sn-glycerol-3-phosphate acyltransferase